MTFNTGNNVPSTDPRDLYDNAENLDKLVNGADPFYADRLGKLRESWSGMENSFNNAQEGRENAFTLSQADKESRFQAFLLSSGYASKGDYAAGVVLAERNEYVAVDAATTGTTAGLYRPGPGATLPLTLTGNWATDSANLVLLGDDVLRQELAAAGGAGMVGTAEGTVQTALGKRVKVVGSIAQLRLAAGEHPGQSVDVLSYHDGWSATARGAYGGGLFYWDDASTATDDGGMVIAVDGVDTGRWRRHFDGAVVWLDWFGAVRDQDATVALKAARDYVASIGGGVVRATGRYLLDVENININADNVFIIGDGPGKTIFERTNTSISLFMFQWASANDTNGGGLLNCELIGVRNPTTGNGAIAFGGAVHYANGYQFKNVVIRRWGQYGAGIYNGNDWDIDRIWVFEHGHTATAISSCMGFNVFPKLTSSNGKLRNIYSVIGSGSLANSAAIKLEQHQNLDAEHIYANGGTEMTCSLSAIGGRVAHVKCVAQGAFPGLILSSRDPSYPTTVGKFTLEDVDCDDPGFNVSLVIASGAGTEPRLEGCKLKNIRAALFRVNNESSYKDCEFHNVRCSLGFRLDHVAAGVTSPTVAVTGNKFLDCSGQTFEYLGNNSLIANCVDVSGSIGASIRGSDNVVKSLHSQAASGNGLTINGSRNYVFDLSVSKSGNANVFVQSGDGNVIHGVSHAPATSHVSNSGTNTDITALVQI